MYHILSIHHKFKFYLQKHSECTYLLRGFQNCSRGLHRRTPLLGDEHLHKSHPSHRFASRHRRYAPQLKAFSILFVNSRPYWKRQGKVRKFHLPWRVVILFQNSEICLTSMVWLITNVTKQQYLPHLFYIYYLLFPHITSF